MKVEYDREEIWLPKSQMEDPEQYQEGDQGVRLSITKWIARQKEID